MNLVMFLLGFPLLVAIIMLLVRQDKLQGTLVKIAAPIILIASVYLFITSLSTAEPMKFAFGGHIVDLSMFVIEMALAAFIFWIGLKYKKYLVSILITIQAALSIYYEAFWARSVAENINFNFIIDKLSIIMVLIIGIIGTLICIYAVGYMKDFQHHHHEVKDRRSLFFFVMFVFLSAMFGIVISNNLMWIFFFWEITTLCSFLLIGYTKTEEATRNAFRALAMNLLGGLAFIIAIVVLAAASRGGVMELDKLLMADKGVIVVAIAGLIAFAGITKSAQLPFSSWLLGAMVAPTPTSALLHSSTMVKAGVYIIIRLAPILNGTLAGFLVSVIGGITFLIASCIAISQSNAKKVLAYSTIANLGLIVACGGIGTEAAVWAAILLVIFHAVAKSLLFLCVGTVEHNIGSRDIEDMDGLIKAMPEIATMIVIGIAGMFIAPFGMLISKWAALKAFIDANPILALLLAFGSAPTLFFWTKWMGKIISIVDSVEKKEKKPHTSERYPLYILSAMTIIVCAIFPVISTKLIDPYLQTLWGTPMSMDRGNIIIMLIMLGLVLLMPIRVIDAGNKNRKVEAYLGGANVQDNTKFRGALGTTQDLTMRNYYLEKYFGEEKWMKTGVLISTALLIILFEVIILWLVR